MRIAICTAAWRRHEILEFFAWFWAGMRDQSKSHGIELDLICAVSEMGAAKIVESHGFKAPMVPNDSLYRKHNAAVQMARGADAVICLGSDDIMNMALLKYYAGIFQQSKPDYIATLDWWFYDTVSRTGLYWGGYREQYRQGQPCGAGRMLSARVLDLLGWSPWIPGYDRMLDEGFRRQMAIVKHTTHFIMMSETPGLAAMDIKSPVNMTPFRPWDNTHHIPAPMPFIAGNFDQEVAHRIAHLVPGPEVIGKPPDLKRKQPRYVKLKR